MKKTLAPYRHGMSKLRGGFLDIRVHTGRYKIYLMKTECVQSAIPLWKTNSIYYLNVLFIRRRGRSILPTIILPIHRMTNLKLI